MCGDVSPRIKRNFPKKEGKSWVSNFSKKGRSSLDQLLIRRRIRRRLWNLMPLALIDQEEEEAFCQASRFSFSTIIAPWHMCWVYNAASNKLPVKALFKSCSQDQFQYPRGVKDNVDITSRLLVEINPCSSYSPVLLFCDIVWQTVVVEYFHPIIPSKPRKNIWKFAGLTAICWRILDISWNFWK